MKHDNGSHAKISVDGTDFRICNVKPFWTGWYSHKFKGPGLRYEVAVAIQSSNIVWTYGPFPCGRFPDITIFRRKLNGLLRRTGESCEADKGYRGERETVQLPDEGITIGGQTQKKLKQRIRSRHETVNARFKSFGCLSQRYRHKLRDHCFCFHAVAVITQIGFDYGNDKLFKIREYRTE